MIVRCPMRVDLVGDETDLLFYCREGAGAVINMAIDRYVTVSTQRGYGRSRLVEAAGLQGQVVCESDVPPGSGLGGSGSLTAALTMIRYPQLSRWQVVEQAWKLEESLNGDVCGGQDQAAAVFGGLRLYQFKQGRLTSWRFVKGLEDELEKWLVCFRVGGERAAVDYLMMGKRAFREDFGMQVYDCLAQLARNAVRCTSVEDFAKYMSLTWALKNLLGRRSTSIIDWVVKTGMGIGALGAKLCGAGGGGYVLFACPPNRQQALREGLVAFSDLPIRQDRVGVIVAGE